MVMHGGGPNHDAFTLSDTGRGRLGRGRSRATILQRRESDGRIDVERFGNYPAAAKGLAVVGIVLLTIVAVAALSVVFFAS